MFRRIGILLFGMSLFGLVLHTNAKANWLHDQKDSFVLGASCVDGKWLKHERSKAYVDEAKRRGLDCNNDVSLSLKNENAAKRLSGYAEKNKNELERLSGYADRFILHQSCKDGVWLNYPFNNFSKLYVEEAKKRKLKCEIVAGIGHGDALNRQKADFSRGVHAFQRGEFKTALSGFKPLAEQGLAAAQ